MTGDETEARGLLSRVGIVGLGLMGGSLALALRAARPELELVGVDLSQATVDRAQDAGLVGESSTDIRAIEGAGLVVLAVPISAMREVLAGVRRAAPDAVVTDLASTKVALLEWSRETGLDLVGGHPMCGRERRGLESAVAGLYEGAPWLLTRPEPAVLELIRSVGAVPVVVDAERHDQLVGGVSHAAFMLAVAYVLALGESAQWPEMARVAGTGFRDMSRLAGGDPELYTWIARTNRDSIDGWLDAIMESLASLRRQLHSDPAGLEASFARAQSLHQSWAAERDRAGDS